jgi:DNA-binding protein H-NS
MVSTLACRDRRGDRDETASRVDSAATDVGRDVREGAADARNDVRESMRDLKSYTWAERDDFRHEVAQRLADADKQLEQIRNDVRASRLTVSDSAMADIHRARRAAHRSLARLDDATENTWTDVRASVDRSFQELRDRIDLVTRTAGPMGGRSTGPS